MTGSNSHFVVPHNGAWAVRKSGATRVSETFEKQSEAIKRGREISKNQKTELIIQGRSGLINRRDSHGHDPYPPKG